MAGQGAGVNRNLAELDRQISEANERLVTTRGQGGKNFVDNATGQGLTQGALPTMASQWCKH